MTKQNGGNGANAGAIGTSGAGASAASPTDPVEAKRRAGRIGGRAKVPKGFALMAQDMRSEAGARGGRKRARDAKRGKDGRFK